MRPKLMIERVRNLHDARYCAAVGISMVSFELDEASASALKPAAVLEISEWLSGLDCIALFERPAVLEDVLSRALAAGTTMLQLPFAFVDQIRRLQDYALILDALDLSGTADWMQALEDALALHPDVRFLVDAQRKGLVDELLQNPRLIEACILRYDAPNAILHQLKGSGLQPFGFSLGAFAADEEGQLDYDACDDFIDQFATLVPA